METCFLPLCDESFNLRATRASTTTPTGTVDHIESCSFKDGRRKALYLTKVCFVWTRMVAPTRYDFFHFPGNTSPRHEPNPTFPDPSLDRTWQVNSTMSPSSRNVRVSLRSGLFTAAISYGSAPTLESSRKHPCSGLVGPDIVPVASKLPGRSGQPPRVWWAIICAKEKTTCFVLQFDA